MKAKAGITIVHVCSDLYESRIERLKIAPGTSEPSEREKRDRAGDKPGRGRHRACRRLHRRASVARRRAAACLVESTAGQTGRRLVSWRSGKAGHADRPGVHHPLLHRRCRSPGGRTPSAVRPVIEKGRRLQLDQRHHKAGYGSRRRAGDDKKTRRRRATDRSRM
jgi:hypothetical protein